MLCICLTIQPLHLPRPNQKKCLQMAIKKNELAEALFQLAQFIQSGDYLSGNIVQRLYATICFFLYGHNLNKYNACRYVKLSRSQFDGYVRRGMIPRGTPEAGSHELRWRECDLDLFLKNKQPTTDIRNAKSAR